MSKIAGFSEIVIYNYNIMKKTKLVANITGKHKFLLPGILTTASLFLSFYSIVSSIGGEYKIAAIAIIIAAFFDAFDGRVARFTNSSSTFGEHYDSLADVIAFGVAPAVLIYTRGADLWNNIGISLAFVYMACCCVRLARFSSTSGEGGKEFNGMPSPTGGGFVAVTIWNLELYPIEPQLAIYVTGIITLITSLLLVSNLPFISGRRFIIFTNHRISINTVGAIFYFSLLAIKPAEVLFLSGCLYICLAMIANIKQGNQKSDKTSEAS